jgi:hypothetical protein
MACKVKCLTTICGLIVYFSVTTFCAFVRINDLWTRDIMASLGLKAIKRVMMGDAEMQTTFPNVAGLAIYWSFGAVVGYFLLRDRHAN